MRYFNVPVSAQMQRLPAYVLQVGGHGSQKPVYREKGSLNWHIFFTVSGEGQFISDDMNCKLSEDNFIIMKANSRHRYFATSDNWETRWILFSGEKIDELMETFGITGNTIIRDFDKGVLEKYFYDVYNLCKKGYDAVSASHILYGLLCEISHWNAEQVKSLPSDTVLRAERYMEYNYGKTITLEEISNFSLVSPQYLCRLFKKQHNMRPFEYLNMLRIKKAQEMLVHGNKSIKSIAKECCFDSPSYFSKVFKQIVGLSPSKYIRYYKE
ncbi:MAG: AraC family transcriptional regulator [Clostridia bacterium]|nr:AraC family transcriptional regulator [Clostridia bacterium]